MHALADESGRLVSDLHVALSEIDSARWHEGAADRARAKLRDIQARLAELTAARWPAPLAALQGKLTELSRRLADEIPSEDGTASSARRKWLAFRRSMAPSYEALQRTLRAFEIHLPSLRPTNYARNALHVTTATLSLSVLWLVPEPWMAIPIAVPLALFGWTLEFLRRDNGRLNGALMRLLGPIAHPHEHRRVNSATWYCTALGLLSLTQAPVPSAIGLAVLGLGDPAAALIGRRWGRLRLIHGRSLEGSLAFLAAATVGGTAAAFAFDPSLGWSTALLLGASGALAGALAELFSLRIDDNLTVALTGAAGAAIAGWLTALG